MPDSRKKQAGESTLTVVIALGANAAIAAMKAVAGLFTGSPALLSEAAHSVADTVNEGLLLTALRRSDRPADRSHPFGYGKERFFWSLIAAVSIFVSGAVFAFYQGGGTILGGGGKETLVWVAYLVLALSALIEGTSWVRALRQTRDEANQEGRRLLASLRTTDDPTVKTVLLEDSAALVGLLLAFAGVLLHQLTGLALFDGLASLLIGVLLTLVAWILGRTNKNLLIGAQADPHLVTAVRERLTAAPEVDQVVDLLTMLVGTDRVLVCARVDFNDGLDSAGLERACVRLDEELRTEFADLDEIFLEPVPRTDAYLRSRVLARYGQQIVDRWRTAQS